MPNQRDSKRSETTVESPARRLIILAGFITQAVGVGSQYFTSVLIQPFKAHLHASQSSVLLATTGAITVASGALAPVFGFLLRRYSTKLLISLSILWTGVGYILLSHVTQTWQLAAIYGLVFSIGNVAGMVGASALIIAWFENGRGVALGFAAMGISCAGFVTPPIASWSLRTRGYESTCICAAVVILASAPIIWLLIKDKGRTARSPSPLANKRPSTTSKDLGSVSPKPNTQSSALSKEFWLIALSTAIPYGTASTLLVNFMQMAQQHGFSVKAAALLISTMAGTAVLSKLVCGYIYDLVAPRWAPIIPAIAFFGTCVLFMQKGSGDWIVAGAVLQGIGVGGTVILPGVLVSSFFKRDQFSFIYGLTSTAGIVATELILLLFGCVFDNSGRYDAALIILSAIVLIPGFTPIFLGRQVLVAGFSPGR